ncbi:MAG: type I methionyl aminopeptidase, partial [Pseudomonadota bacterium]|nr:type I methionyl aminopeptidase [Pseudomonadota bacterium]
MTRAQDLEGLRAAGRAVAQTLAAMGAALTPGMTTAELDALGAKMLAEHGARSAPQRDYRFPGATCISLNEEAAHGIPGPRTLAPGDIVNIDVSAELNGYYGDTGATFLVPPAAPEHEALLAATQAALDAALAVAQPGAFVNEIGRAIESTARAAGFTTLRDLGSHGVGRKLHEAPRFIPN